MVDARERCSLSSLLVQSQFRNHASSSLFPPMEGPLSVPAPVDGQDDGGRRRPCLFAKEGKYHTFSGFSLCHRTQKTIFIGPNGVKELGGSELKGIHMSSTPLGRTDWEADLRNVQSWTFETGRDPRHNQTHIILSELGVEEQKHEIMDSPIFHTEGISQATTLSVSPLPVKFHYTYSLLEKPEQRRQQVQ